MHFRRPTLHDLNECAQLDPGYTTQRVWQMNLRTEPSAIQVDFHLVHLPRSITVANTFNGDDLLAAWQRGDCMISVRDGNSMLGLIHMLSETTTRTGLIDRHVVTPSERGKGIGAALLQRAMQWGADRNLRTVKVQVGTKNHPAIAFYLNQGFTFCGFNERFYGDQEIIFDLSRSIR